MNSFCCPRCQIVELWSTDDACFAAEAWHFYELHRASWNLIVGDRPPARPHPETLGLQVSERERATG